MTLSKGTIGVLTGGGDVPGLNPAIRALTVRALLEGYRVIGLRRGWGGLVDLVRSPSADNSACYVDLDLNIVNRASRTGGTFLSVGCGRQDQGGCEGEYDFNPPKRSSVGGSGSESGGGEHRLG